MGKQIAINIKNKPPLSINSNSPFTNETFCFDIKTIATRKSFINYNRGVNNYHDVHYMHVMII